MTVQELIEVLEEVDDKNIEVFAFDIDNGNLIDIISVDIISDRVDINIGGL